MSGLDHPKFAEIVDELTTAGGEKIAEAAKVLAAYNLAARLGLVSGAPGVTLH